VSCRHSSVMWAVGHTSPTYCRYLPSIKAGTKLYCLVTEAHVCEQLAQSHYLTEEWLEIKPATFGSLVQCHNHYTTKQHLHLQTNNSLHYLTIINTSTNVLWIRNWHTLLYRRPADASFSLTRWQHFCLK